MKHARTEFVGVRTTPELRKALEEDAKRNDVPISTVVRRVLLDHYRSRGVLPEPVNASS